MSLKVIAHVDLDAFYTQVEIARDPGRLKDQPVVVIQYNPYGDLRTLRPDEDRIKPESNGSIIAVSYEARKFGVKRNMMAQQAKKLCPTLQIVQVPVAHGKADLTIYRDAGAAVINILSKSAVCERASIDEAYLDVTAAAQKLLAAGAAKHRQEDSGSFSCEEEVDPSRKLRSSGSYWTGGESIRQDQQHLAAAAANADGDEGGVLGDAEGAAGAANVGAAVSLLPCPDSFDGWHVAGVEPSGPEAIRGWWSSPHHSWSQSDQLLAAGALVVARARAAVSAALGFSCSAGIAHSKILAKLGSGLNKPAQQTVVPAAAVQGLLAPLPLPKLRQLGGKFGEEVMATLGISTVGELAAVPLPRLESALGEQQARWLHRLAQGLDDEEVKPRMLPKSISCGKTFRGATALTSLTAVHHWLLQLGQELQERIEADRHQHQRLPRLLTVSFDSGPLQQDGAAAATAALALVGPAAAVPEAVAAGSNTSFSAGAEDVLLAGEEASSGVATGNTQTAIAGAGNGNAGGRSSGGSSGRPTPQNWRAGLTAVSRSCNLRHPKADAIAADALALVKKWARDRPTGWRIVGMFISASSFSLAPTGASTLDRFFSAPATTNTSAAVAAGQMHPGQQQRHSYDATASAQQAGTAASVLETAAAPKAAGRMSGSKRPAASAVQHSKPMHRSKAPRAEKGQAELRAFFVASGAAAGASPAASPKFESNGIVAAAGAAAGGQDGCFGGVQGSKVHSSSNGNCCALSREVAAAQGSNARLSADAAEAVQIAAMAQDMLQAPPSKSKSDSTAYTTAAADANPTPGSLAFAPGTADDDVAASSPNIHCAIPAVSVLQLAGAGAIAEGGLSGSDAPPRPAAVAELFSPPSPSPCAGIMAAAMSAPTLSAPTAGTLQLQNQLRDAVMLSGGSNSQDAQPNQVVASLQTWLNGQQQQQLQADSKTCQHVRYTQQQSQQQVGVQFLGSEHLLPAAASPFEPTQEEQQLQEQEQAGTNRIHHSVTHQQQGRQSAEQHQQVVRMLEPSITTGGDSHVISDDAAAASTTAAADKPGQDPALNRSIAAVQPTQLTAVDPEVLAALPWDIQMEVQQHIRTSRAASANGRSKRDIGGRSAISAKRSRGRGAGHRSGSMTGVERQLRGGILKYFNKK